ncbi:MAG: hypothetical protein IPP40_01965 [bacterium]|nr:hypothetical protein [bacterium]
MDANFTFFVIAVSLLVSGCAATQPKKVFAEMAPIEQSPEVFAGISDQPGQVDAKISLRAPGLKGSATGIVRHAQGGQYLIELYGRGELFLKVYFTGKQTILWPATGMPEFFNNDNIPTLRTSVHSLLPSWRLDDVLPVPRTQIDTSAKVVWKKSPANECAQKIDRTGFDTIYKAYIKPADDPCFPYRVVSFGNEAGTSRLTWSLRPHRQSSY